MREEIPSEAERWILVREETPSELRRAGSSPPQSPARLSLPHPLQDHRLRRPIQGVDARSDPSPERGVRPVDGARDIAMLHGIDVYVVDNAVEIVVVTHQVLPIASLPDAPLPAGDTPR